MTDTVMLPYGKGQLKFTLPEDMDTTVCYNELEDFCVLSSQEELVSQALSNPIGSDRLCNLAKQARTAVVISSDHTRPVPSRITMPLLLEELRRNNPSIQITILVATGCHRASTRQELIEKYGQEIAEHEHIVIHDCDAQGQLTDLGTLSSGNRLLINRLAAEADLLVAEGFVEPHFFAGFSGGRKSVLPGIAGRSSILYNHSAQHISHGQANTGNLRHNPIHEDMLEAAERAGLSFVLNIALNHQKQVIAAFSGDFIEAHQTAVAFLEQHCVVKAPLSDIVVVTNEGVPLDQNIYQCVKGMSAAETVCRTGGVIIVAAQCGDGHGGESFYRMFAEEQDNQALMDHICHTSPENTVPDQWQAQILLRILLRCSVVLVSDAPHEMVKNLHLIPADTMEEAVEIARKLLPTGCKKLTVIPQGVSGIVQLEQ